MTPRNIVAVALLLLAGAFRYTEPIHDGDLFWHMAYGRWMLQHHTLVPDHSAFSWTPTDNHIIYCAWMGQMFLHLLHSLGGLAALFGLRYAVVLGALGAHFRVGLKCFGSTPFTMVVLMLLWLLGSFAGTAIKPELLSFALWNVLVCWIFLAQSSRAPTIRWGLPVLFLVWANTHGAFLFGLLLLGCVWLGIRLDRWQCPSAPPGAIHLRWVGLCFLVSLLTPYGASYYLQQYTERLASADNQLAVSISAHWEPIYTLANAKLHLFEVWVVMMGLWLYALTRRARGSPLWQFVLPSLVFAGLALVHIRTSYYWPTLWVYTLLAWRIRPPKRVLASSWAKNLFLIAVAALSLRTCWESYAEPGPLPWFGPGLS